jgi:hypothetical protein
MNGLRCHTSSPFLLSLHDAFTFDILNWLFEALLEKVGHVWTRFA